MLGIAFYPGGWVYVSVRDKPTFRAPRETFRNHCKESVRRKRATGQARMHSRNLRTRECFCLQRAVRSSGALQGHFVRLCRLCLALCVNVASNKCINQIGDGSSGAPGDLFLLWVLSEPDTGDGLGRSLARRLGG